MSRKPVIVEVEKAAMNPTTGAEIPYEKFIFAKSAAPLFDQKALSLAATKKILADWGYEVPREIKSIEDLFDWVRELDASRADNTYNWGWWGPTIHLVALQQEHDPYEPTLYFVRMHLGGDVRGNYSSPQAFYVEIPAEEAPWYSYVLEVDLTTEDGKRVELQSQDAEAYHFIVNRDETGTFDESGYAKYDDLQAAFDFQVDLWR